jgi:cytochrome P450
MADPRLDQERLVTQPDPHGAVKCPVDFDHHGDFYADHWPEIYAELHQSCPRAWVDRYDGFWLATGYDDLMAIAHRTDVISTEKLVDPDTGIETRGATIPTVQGGRSILVETDSPEWDGLRKFVTSKFSPKAAEDLRDRTMELAHRLIDEFVEDGEVDFVDQLTNPLPAMIAVETFGFPLSEWHQLSEPMHMFFALPRDDPRLAEAAAGVMHFNERVAEEIAARRVEPRDDLLSYFAHGTIAGKPLDDETIRDLSFQIMSGGVDTTGSVAASALRYLSSHPDQRRWLAEDPSRLAKACEEFVRYFTPVQGSGRTLTADALINGWSLRDGDRVLMSFAAANRDPEHFPDPDSLILDRAPNRHVGYGAGQHRCLGAFLARMMFRLLLEVVLARIPDFVVDESRVVRYPSLGFVNGYVHLPATFTPGTRMSS